ncbi:dTDP-4-dehydrorhamnose 3,5-epimerase [Candidatus Latescibacterota bacterium]
MKCIPTEIPDVVLIELDMFEDERGFFMETYNTAKFAKFGISTDFVQDNHSYSKKGVLRGMHYQITQSQGKLIEVISGDIFDVVIDIRKQSPTFGKWIGIPLSSKDKSIIWIPIGFAHGFYVLSEYAEIKYKVTDFYSAEAERTLLWNDRDLDIKWPLADNQQPILSPKDAAGKPFSEIDVFE